MPATRKAAAKPTGRKTQPARAAVAPAVTKARSLATKQLKRGLKTSPERIARILAGLEKAYPGATCALLHRNAWELLVATILSAQCTDARVNVVTPTLFRAFPTPAAMARASLPELEDLIRTTGFFRNKAKSISGAARQVVEQFGGKVPQTMAELLTLPGVARKTGNVVLGTAYGIADGIVVDTHVLRLSRRLELTANVEPVKVEQDLMKIIPKGHWIEFSHELILHGRAVCIARKPRCADCTIESECDSSDKTWSSH
ncbi:MAG: endonuclease [Acidobacteriaceae bacterium]|nr:endonuclease [Acidobacteriaceae bacterium]